ncbi:MAG: COG1361 S-layer family protein [Candidatus Aenigmatarchaeota archaeon]
MKRLFLLLTIFSLFAVPVVAASLTITYQVMEDYVRPGSQTTVILTFTNPSTTTDVTNLRVTITAGPDLSVSTSSVQIGTLGAGSSQQASVVVTASSTAKSQQSYISVLASYGVNSATKETRINVPIAIRSPPLLQVSNVNFSSPPTPGSSVILNFDLVNNGNGPAKDVSVSLTQSSGLFTVSGSSESFVTTIRAKGREPFSFEITIDPAASVGTQLIPVKLIYYDEAKTTSYNETKNIGLPISGQAEFVVTLDETRDFYFGRKGIATISISNSGTGSAEFLTAKVTSDYGSKEIYIGKLEPDDTETVDIEQDLKAATGIYDITIELSYRDSYNNPFTVTRTVSVTPTAAPIELPWAWIILLVVIAGGIWWWKSKK